MIRKKDNDIILAFIYDKVVLAATTKHIWGIGLNKTWCSRRAILVELGTDRLIVWQKWLVSSKHPVLYCFPNFSYIHVRYTVILCGDKCNATICAWTTCERILVYKCTQGTWSMLYLVGSSLKSDTKLLDISYNNRSWS